MIFFQISSLSVQKVWERKGKDRTGGQRKGKEGLREEEGG